MKTLQVLGVCAGNGATLYPFFKNPNRYNVVANIEPRSIFYTLKNEQWVANYPGIRISRNALGVSNIDIIVGHPDCGHSSTLTLSTKKGLGDPKENESLLMFMNSIKLYSPKVWMMENLTGLLESYPEEWWIKEFKRYRFKFIKAPVTKFGNSQVNRERLVIVAVSKKLKPWKFSFPKTEPKSVEELIGDIAGTTDILFGQAHEPLDKTVSLWWDGEQVTLEKARELWNGPLKDSKTWPGYYNTKTQPGVYKLKAGDPPKTARKQDRQFNHLGLPLTPREMGRIQGLPDDFILYMEDTKVGYWVNKARATATKCPPYELYTWFDRMIAKNFAGKKKKKTS